MSLKDFDAYFSEVEQEPIKFKVKGKEFKLPDSLPAAVMFKIMRLQADSGPDDDVSPEDAINMMEQVFGKETNEKLLATGIGFDQYQEILKWAMEELSGKNKKAAKKTV